MNRSLANVLFGGIAAPSESAKKIEGVATKVWYCDRAPPKGLTSSGKTSVEETVEALLDAESVIITPGYGLAVAKAVRFSFPCIHDTP
jgi:H+-translocating NAD(P) transhydrogenase